MPGYLTNPILAADTATISPSGNLSSTTVQTAITELESEKVFKSGGDTITASSSSVIPLILKGASSQTANLFEIRNSSNTLLYSLDKDGNISSAGLYMSEQSLTISVSDETTNLTTGTAKITFRAPFAMTLTKIPRASVTTASTSGIPTIDIKLNSVSILGANKLTIDANEKTSVTAATATTLATTSVVDDDEITIDVTTAGTNTKGLKVTIYYKRA